MINIKTLNQVELYAGSLLLDSRDRVYLIKEDDRNKISKGRWNLPGGAVRAGEDLIAAAKRTTENETGFEVEIYSLIGNYKCTKDNKEWTYAVFEARTSGDKIKNRKISETVSIGRWFERGKIIHMNSDQIVHPDMQLVYNIAIEERGLPLDAVKYIDYNTQ